MATGRSSEGHTLSMSAEVSAAVEFIVSHLSSVLPHQDFRSSLSESLVASLESKYANHWHSEDPERGSAYRAITPYGSIIDDILSQAIKNARLSIPTHTASEALKASLGSDRWTMWIDPGCVSIRLNGGGVHFNTSANSLSEPNINTTSSSSSSKSINHAGITEIWGKLPTSIRGAITFTSTTTTMMTNLTGNGSRPKTPSKLSRASDKEATALAAEFEALALNASPVKRNKAVAIVRPDSAASFSSNGNQNLPLSAQQPMNKALAAVAGTVAGPVATPPRPLPPLSFTIQESTSPYVPSFATGSVTSNDAIALPQSATSTTGSSSTRSATPTPPLALHRDVNENDAGLASPPLYTSESLVSSSSSSSAASFASSSDPFARPSSRSSTTSVGSNASCSIFSHSSNESRSSSIGSISTMASSIPALAENAKFSSVSTPRASPGEMDAAKQFTFPNSNSNNTLTVTSLAGLLPGSAPNSPSKPRRASRHNHTMSTSSVISATSSTGSATSKSTTGHARSRTSRSDIRVNTNAGQVQDYSNGKVGVLGGGVLLGLGGGSKKTSDSNVHKRAHSSASSGSTLHVNNATVPQRPRSKSRTPSSGSATSTGSNGEHYHQQHHFASNNLSYHNQAGSNQYWQAAQQAQAYRYGAPPVPMLPPQYAGQGY